MMSTKWSHAASLLVFLTSLLLINCTPTEEEFYNIKILSISPGNNSYEIIGSTYDDDNNVEWVALHSQTENFFLEDKIDKYSIVLYNVKNESYIKLKNLYHTVHYFDILNNNDILKALIQHDDLAYVLTYNLTDPTNVDTSVTSCSHAYLLKLEDNPKCLDSESLPENSRIINVNENDIFIYDGEKIYNCDIEGACKQAIPDQRKEDIKIDFLVRQRILFYKDGNKWIAFEEEDNKFECNLSGDVYDIAKTGSNWKISTDIYNDEEDGYELTKPENPFNINIKDSRGFESSISIFSSSSYTIVAVPKGKFTCKENPKPDPAPPETPPSKSPEAPQTAPEKEPVETTPQKSTERSATTWAIVVIILIALSGLAYIAWRYFRGQNPNPPFLGENNT